MSFLAWTALIAIVVWVGILLLVALGLDLLGRAMGEDE